MTVSEVIAAIQAEESLAGADLSGQGSRNAKLGAAKLQGCDMKGADFFTILIVS